MQLLVEDRSKNVIKREVYNEKLNTDKISEGYCRYTVKMIVITLLHLFSFSDPVNGCCTCSTHF